MSPIPNSFAFRRRVPGRSFIRVAWWDFGALLCWSMLKVCYRLRRLHRERVPKTGALLVISNHQSFLDPMVNGVTVWDRQFTALAKVSARPIRREGGDLEAMKMAISELEAGRVVIMYPEGTRSPDGSLQDFKRGVLLLIKRVKPTVLPMGVTGTFAAWPKGQKFPHARGRVVCLCGEPISGEALAKLSSEEALAVMRDAVAKLHAEAVVEHTAWVAGAR